MVEVVVPVARSAKSPDDSKPYDQAVFLTTHNSYANTEDGWGCPWGAEQRHAVPKQLQNGISALMPDI